MLNSLLLTSIISDKNINTDCKINTRLPISFSIRDIPPNNSPSPYIPISAGKATKYDKNIYNMSFVSAFIDRINIRKITKKLRKLINKYVSISIKSNSSAEYLLCIFNSRVPETDCPLILAELQPKAVVDICQNINQ